VAALVIGKRGGTTSPGQVQAILRRSADDPGSPGRDAFFGWGRVNAERAVAMTPE
jgi:lantibiotic leader peptide-processing serine protease